MHQYVQSSFASRQCGCLKTRKWYIEQYVRTEFKGLCTRGCYSLRFHPPTGSPLRRRWALFHALLHFPAGVFGARHGRVHQDGDPVDGDYDDTGNIPSGGDRLVSDRLHARCELHQQHLLACPAWRGVGFKPQRRYFFPRVIRALCPVSTIFKL